MSAGRPSTPTPIQSIDIRTDIGVCDASNKTFNDASKLNENDNYYCWGQPVLAMSSGAVIFVADGFEDHFGNVTNPASLGANAVIIRNDALDIHHIYVHFKKNSIVVQVGDVISPGDKLGLIGNSGGSSEPHLHVGINRRDAEGFLRSLPMTFDKIRTVQTESFRVCRSMGSSTASSVRGFALEVNRGVALAAAVRPSWLKQLEHSAQC